MEAASDGSSQLTGEQICFGRGIMQDLVPCQGQWSERGRVCWAGKKTGSHNKGGENVCHCECLCAFVCVCVCVCVSVC